MNNPEAIDNPEDSFYTIYKTSFWTAMGSGFSIIIALVFGCYLLIDDKGPFIERSFILLFVLIFGGLLAYMVNRYLARSKEVLKVSIDTNIFYFSDGTYMEKYNKNNITKITIYQPGGGGTGKRLHYFYVYEILFKDGTSIKFSNMLISEKDVLNNFPENLVRYDPKSPFWRL